MSLTIEITEDNAPFYMELLYDSIVFNPNEIERLVLFEKNCQKMTMCKLFKNKHKIKMTLVEALSFENALENFKTEDPEKQRYVRMILFSVSPQVEKWKRQVVLQFQKTTAVFNSKMMLEGGI